MRVGGGKVRGRVRGCGGWTAVVGRTGVAVDDIKGWAGNGCAQICGGYAECGWMHEGGRWIDVHGGVLVWQGHFEVMVILGKVIRVGVVLCVLGYGFGGWVEVVIAEDPDETPVSGWTYDAT